MASYLTITSYLADENPKSGKESHEFCLLREIAEEDIENLEGKFVLLQGPANSTDIHCVIAGNKKMQHPFTHADMAYALFFRLKDAGKTKFSLIGAGRVKLYRGSYLQTWDFGNASTCQDIGRIIPRNVNLVTSSLERHIMRLWEDFVLAKVAVNANQSVGYFDEDGFIRF